MDGTGVVRWLPVKQRQVDFIDLAAHKLSAQVSLGLDRTRHDHESRCLLVEPMYEFEVIV